MSDLNDWDITAANNNDGPPDGWPENTMQYSEVNNTGREGMAVLARFWNDLNGSLQFTGSADAYAVTLNAGYAAYFQGMAFLAEINITNTGATTIDVNGLGTKTVETQAGDAMSNASLIAGGIYEFRYDGTVFQLLGGGIADGGVTTAKLADEAVTLPKLLHIATDSFLGRDTAATGDVEVLSATTARSVLNVENGSTADQTAGEIEAIVDHDLLVGYVAAEHIDWESAGAENIEAARSINGALALAAGEVTQLANIGATVISAADWAAVAALVGTNTGDQTSIVGITGTTAQFNTANTDGTFAISGGAFHDGFSDFVADEHVAHAGVTMTAGDGLSGGGTIAATRSFAVDSTVIRTTGTQAIGGAKTFDTRMILANGSAGTPSQGFATDTNTGTFRGGTDIIAWACNGTERMTLSAAGALVCDDDITAFSDERLKEQLEIIPDALDKISRINGYTFMRNDHFGRDGESLDVKRHAGVLAQEVVKVLPEVISENDEGILGTAYGNMAALFIEAIKELMGRIEELEYQTSTVSP